MARPVNLPSHVTLQASRGGLVPVGDVYAALSCSRARAYTLREGHGFPHSNGGMIDVQAAGAWLVARNVVVNFV